MRNFDYKEQYKKLLTPDIVTLLSQIHEYKGEQTLFIEAKKDALTELLQIAKIQSTEASNKIEGIYTSNQRIIAGDAQFTGNAAGRGVGFTTGLLLLREGLGMRETPIRPHSWH